MIELILRKAGPEDLLAVMDIENSSFEHPWPANCLLPELNDGKINYSLIAEIDGKVAGYLMTWRVVDEFHIINIAVAPDFRRNGVASAFLGALVDEARLSGINSMTLEVREGNSGARKFYERHHFKEVGVRPKYYRDSGEDALIMTRSVDE
jgi:[ribosomal protein S18]-alanine N-acetyltransferase